MQHLIKQNEDSMKNVQIKKLARVEAPKGEYDDIQAFQLVEFTVNFYGKIIVDTLDTKITKSGQFVISGNGFIPDGYQIQ